VAPLAFVQAPVRDHSGQEGQGLVEYGLILGLAAIVTVVALLFFGEALATALSLIGQAIDAS
jgi:Flp pilus assembly pilin Flp